MNENIDLTEILKDCPKGWKFYSSVYGDVEFVEILPNIPFPKRSQENGLYLLKTLMLELHIRLKADFLNMAYRAQASTEKELENARLFLAQCFSSYSNYG